MRIRMIATAALAVAALGAFAGAAPAAGPAPGLVDCIGLTCPQAPGGAAVPAELGLTAPSLLGPQQLVRQKTAGYYEFGHGTTLGKTAVAYVIPPGQTESAPPEIRALRVFGDISPSDYRTGTVVIYDAGTALWVPSSSADDGVAARAAAAKRTRPAARAAAPDLYGCDDMYFCIYQSDQFQGRRLQWHDISSSWTNLGDYGFNDEADSSRNRRDRDSWLAEHTGGGGDRHCYDSHSSDADFGGWGNDASSTYNSAGDAGC